MIYTKVFLKEAHKHSSNNKKQILNSTVCGCFYCKRFLKPEKIKEWIDKGSTALCPYCRIDSIIGNASKLPLSEIFLSEMEAYWFRCTKKIID